MGSGVFDFNIGNLKSRTLSRVTVNNSQIELDAFAFAWFIGISVFGVELHLNGVRSGKQLLSSYIQFISNNYSLEELRDCLEYSGFAYNRNQA